MSAGISVGMKTVIGPSRENHVWVLTPEGIVEVDESEGVITHTAPEVAAATRMIHHLVGRIVASGRLLHTRTCPGAERPGDVSPNELSEAVFFDPARLHACVHGSLLAGVS